MISAQSPQVSFNLGSNQGPRDFNQNQPQYNMNT
jgi:CRP-like cAMP-binding protein